MKKYRHRRDGYMVEVEKQTGGGYMVWGYLEPCDNGWNATRICLSLNDLNELFKLEPAEEVNMLGRAEVARTRRELLSDAWYKSAETKSWGSWAEAMYQLESSVEWLLGRVEKERYHE